MMDYAVLNIDDGALARKRLFDLSVASVLLLAADPILLACAAYVRIVSPGPALFRQERIGRDGRVFKILKLRTMRHQPEQAGSSTTVLNLWRH